MSRTLKVGVIGANWTLNFHAPAWRMLPGVEVAAVCTSREATARAAAERAGIERAYWNVEDMVADPDLDIIDVGTKPSQRYDMVMAALSAGKHVYNCLPFATSTERAEAMRDLALSKNLVGVVDAQWRWTPAIRKMKEMIDEGAIGKFFTATIHLQLPLYVHDGFTYTLCHMGGGGTPYPWLAEKASGASAWRNFGSHTILCLLYLFGEVEEIIGASDIFVKELNFEDGSVLRPQTPDFGLAMLRFRSGGLANINVSWAMADAPGFYLDVCGSAGRLVARDPGFCDTTTTLHYGQPTVEPSGVEVDIPERFYEVPGTNLSKINSPPFMAPIGNLFADMVRVIRTGSGDGSPSFSDAAHAHAAVEAAVLSETTRKWEKVERRR
ncbi:Gfo/Idh/MocA family oxidoreductase [Novosphingobium sp. G106]|uniref:Gfo/Idh/MocA family protein n=1 Tax=Novosphingobium sp. G106 TaxID=2849500 RepID=UPI001C2D05E3|nr:Gfo/Idh/MocA family oxidoreductase [Novosphingobium sp. G106]MBV1688963.1 Gfo/Idh/MocA family oxidoreductase [Novosphingobium sp. G106]